MKYILSITLLGVSANLAIASGVKMELFDLNKNGIYEESERKAAVRHAASSLYREGDKNYDGILTDEEKEDYLTSELQKAEVVVAASEPEITKRPPENQEDTARTFGIEESKSGEYWPLGGIQLRRTLADVNRNRGKTRSNPDKYAQDLKAAKAAEFAFVDNGLSGDESWAARGVIALPFPFTFPDGEGGAILPSIQFDRVTHSDSTPEIDNLIFGLEAAYIADGDGTLFEMSRTSLGAEYGTNFEWENRNYGGRLEWEPTLSPIWIGNIASQSLFSLPILYQTRQFAHFEGGYSESTAVSGSTEYARLGGGAGINFFFTPPLLERLSLGVDYRFYVDLTDGSDDFETFRATAAFQLDEKGHVEIKGTYEDGLTPLNHQEIDLFTLGLGVKF